MSSQQQSRNTGPYAYSTPSMGRIDTMSGMLSANRSASVSTRAARGTGSRQPLGDIGGNIDSTGGGLFGEDNASAPTRESVSTEKILAAIASLSKKIDLDIANLSDKVDEEILALTNNAEDHFTAVTNKLDQVTEKVDQIEDHLLTPGANQANQAPAGAPVAQAQAPPAQPWNYSKQLKDRVYAAAYGRVSTPEIEAYTKRESPNGDLLVGSLFNTIRQEINNIPAPWPEQQLPPQINGVTDVAAIRNYHKLVKNAGKHARERMHHLVLHNVRNPREPNVPPEGTIPSIKRLIYRIANHCGDDTDNRDVETLWDQTEWAHRLRITYLRREAMRIFQAVRRGEGRPDIWARVDRQLHKLRVEGPVYTTAFYRLVYNDDLASFDGNVHITQIDPMLTFDLPSEEAIQEEVERFQAEGIGAGNV